MNLHIYRCSQGAPISTSISDYKDKEGISGPERLSGVPSSAAESRQTQESSSGLVRNKQVSPTLFLPLTDFSFKGISPRDFLPELQTPRQRTTRNGVLTGNSRWKGLGLQNTQIPGTLFIWEHHSRGQWWNGEQCDREGSKALEFSIIPQFQDCCSHISCTTDVRSAPVNMAPIPSGLLFPGAS